MPNLPERTGQRYVKIKAPWGWVTANETVTSFLPPQLPTKGENFDASSSTFQESYRQEGRGEQQLARRDATRECTRSILLAPVTSNAKKPAQSQASAKKQGGTPVRARMPEPKRGQCREARGHPLTNRHVYHIFSGKQTGDRVKRQDIGGDFWIATDSLRGCIKSTVDAYTQTQSVCGQRQGVWLPRTV